MGHKVSCRWNAYHQFPTNTARRRKTGWSSAEAGNVMVSGRGSFIKTDGHEEFESGDR
jgi:hypothetical protein